jgi:hypothetical protein
MKHASLSARALDWLMQEANSFLNGALIIDRHGRQTIVPHVAADWGRPGGDYTTIYAASRIRGQRADWIVIDDIHIEEHGGPVMREKFQQQWFQQEDTKMCEQSDCKCPAPPVDPNEFEGKRLSKSRPFGVVTQTVKEWRPSSSWVLTRRYLNTDATTFASYKEALAYAKAKSAELPEVAFMVVTLSDVLATVPPPARLTHTRVRTRK